jgi:5-methylcytosine-specific restriction endonuclease McrA
VPRNYTRLLNPFFALRGHKRRSLPDELRERVFLRDEYWCQYCEDAPALVVDHVVPFSSGGSDEERNLRASCELCNMKAYNRFFASYTAKREWLRHFREEFRSIRAKRLSMCIQCRGFYAYRLQGATAFLCPSCTRREYGDD